jgi:hypothetical protein
MPFYIGQDETHCETFHWQTPTEVPLTTYIGNCVMWRNVFGRGELLDRSIFWVTLF